MALEQALIAFKKLFGKPHTSPNKQLLANETLSVGFSLNANQIFGENIPTSPPTGSFYDVDPSYIVEKIRLEAEFITGTDTAAGRHGFQLKLPADYETSSSNPNAGTGFWVNGQILNETTGAVQIVPPSFGETYRATLRDSTLTTIPELDAREWISYEFGGIVYQQTPPGTGDDPANPNYYDCYLFIGNMANQGLSTASGSNLGTGEQIFVGTTSSGNFTILEYRTITGTGSVGASTVGNEIILSGSVSPDASGSNLGTGEEIFIGTTSSGNFTILEHRTIKGTGSVGTSTDGNEIIISGSSAPENFSYITVTTGSTVTIPINQQMLYEGDLTIDGDLIVDGDTVQNNDEHFAVALVTNNGAGLIFVSGSSTPVSGQVLTALGPNSAAWENAGGGNVDSVFGRTGSVTAQPSDYDASQIDNDSTVVGSFVDDALNALSSSHTNLSGAVATDINSVESSITNLSTSVATDVNTIESSITTLSTSVASDVNNIESSITTLSTSVATDINSIESSVTNLSTSVATDINSIESSITNLSTSVASDVNNIENTISQLSASDVTNDSNVVGSTVKDALNTLSSSIVSGSLSSISGTNYGTGTGVFASVSGSNTLNFHSFQGIGGTSISLNGDSIEISSSVGSGGDHYAAALLANDGGTIVFISGAATPVSGQVLTAIGSTNAQWETQGVPSHSASHMQGGSDEVFPAGLISSTTIPFDVASADLLFSGSGTDVVLSCSSDYIITGVLQVQGQGYTPPVTLSSTSSIILDFNTSTAFEFVLNQNTAISASNFRNGAMGALTILHDGTSNAYALSWSSDFRRMDSENLNPTQISGAIDIYSYVVRGGTICISKAPNWVSV